VSRYAERKRVVKDKNMGPLIATDMTRCIHCTRCVRFGQEIAGIREMGATGRGEHTVIGTYVEQAVDSELSGNVIDLCPVGALTSKPFRFSARAWEMTQRDSVAPHDCIGSNVHLHTRGNRVMRVVPRENESINEVWISDRDRFSYEGLHSEDRLTTPMIKQDGQWQETDWNTALEFAAGGLKDVIEQQGMERVGALVSPSATLEEMYLVHKLVRGLGGANIDHRLRQVDFRGQERAPAFPWLGQSIADLEQLDAALLVGSNVRKEQPLAGHRLRKAAMAGAKLMFINAVDYEFNFDVAEKSITDPLGMVHTLAGVTKAALELSGTLPSSGLDALLASVEVSTGQRAMAELLSKVQKATVLLGTQALAHPELSALCALADELARASGAVLGYLPEAANSAGAWLAGVVPHRIPGGKGALTSGPDAGAMLASGLDAYLLLGVEPELDCADSGAALAAMRGARFVVSLSAYRSQTMQEYADVLLPVAPFSETSGTFVNAEGRWQSFAAGVNAQGEARPGWRVLRVLGNLFDVKGFEYFSSEEVRDELQAAVADSAPDNSMSWECPAALPVAADGIQRIAEVPVYATDALVRRATALQQTADARPVAAYVNETLAERLGLAGGEQARVRQGDVELELPLVIDGRIPDGCVLIPAALPGSVGLGAMGSIVGLERVS